MSSPPASARASRSLTDRLALAILGAFAAAWLLWSLAANLDAANGRFALFMDEIVSYDGIVDIQRAPSAEELVKRVIGTDQRYGRPMWYIPAFLTAPFAEMGDGRGGIVATRMLFALTLLGAIALLAHALIDRWTWRAGAIIAGAVIPFAAYYATMPKPEPFQLLFLAAFIWLLARRGQNLGWSWIFLGLAFGMKISTLPALAPLGALALAREWALNRRIAPLKLVFTPLAFTLGFLAAAPVVLTAGGLRLYIGHTWANTGHAGSDSAAVTALSWLNFMNEGGFFGPAHFSAVGVAAIALIALMALVLSFRRTGEDGALRAFFAGRSAVSLAVLGAGLLLTAAIAIGVKRLWGFYLFPGALLMLVAAFSLAEQLTLPPATRPMRWSAAALGALVFALSYGGGAHETFSAFKQQAHRSDQAEFQLRMAQHAEMTEQSEALARQLGRPIRVLFRATFFFPDSTKTVTYDPFYGLRDVWTVDYDLIFLEPDPDPAAFAASADHYDEQLRAFYAQRAAHLTSAPGEPCQTAPCFAPVPLASREIQAWRRVEEKQAAPTAP